MSDSFRALGLSSGTAQPGDLQCDGRWRKWSRKLPFLPATAPALAYLPEKPKPCTRGPARAAGAGRAALCGGEFRAREGQGLAQRHTADGGFVSLAGCLFLLSLRRVWGP